MGDEGLALSKTQSFRCFHSIQGMSSVAEARPLRIGLGVCCRTDSHQVLVEGSPSLNIYTNNQPFVIAPLYLSFPFARREEKLILVLSNSNNSVRRRRPANRRGWWSNMRKYYIGIAHWNRNWNLLVFKLWKLWTMYHEKISFYRGVQTVFSYPPLCSKKDT